MIVVHLNRLDEWDALQGLGDILIEAARAALECSDHPPEGEISITFVADDEMRAMNRTYLGRDRLTDVIAFEFGEPGRLLGDVYISPEAALRSAAEEKEAPRTEFIRLVVHGTLHTLGHDHPEDSDRWESPMFALQESVVRQVTGDGPSRAENGDD